MTNIKIELQDKQDVSIEGKQKVELHALKQELFAKQKELMDKKTTSEVQKFLQDVPFFIDRQHCRILIGDTYVESNDDAHFTNMLQTIRSDIQIANHELEKRAKNFAVDTQNQINATTGELGTMGGILEHRLTVTVTGGNEQNVVPNSTNVSSTQQTQQQPSPTASTQHTTGTPSTSAQNPVALAQIDAPNNAPDTVNAPHAVSETNHRTEQQKQRNFLQKIADIFSHKNNLDRNIGKLQQAEVKAMRDEMNAFISKRIAYLQDTNPHKGEFTMTAQEAYVSSFLEKHGDTIATASSDQQLESVFTAYRNGKSNNYTVPAEIIAIGVDNTPNTTTNTQSNTSSNNEQNTSSTSTNILDGMSDIDKQKHLQNIMQELMGSMKIETIQVNGKNQDVINISSAQYQQLQQVVHLGGADAGYSAIHFEPSRRDKKVDRQMQKIQDDLANGNTNRGKRRLKRLNERLEDEAETARENNILSQRVANLNNSISYNAQIAQGALDIGQGSYKGYSVDVVPQTVLFKNICANVNTTLATQGYMVLQGGPNGPVLVQCPDRMNAYGNQALEDMGAAYGYGPDVINGCKQPGLLSGFTGGVEGMLNNYTKMNPLQARKGAQMITLASVGLAAYGLYKYIFKGGEEKSSKGWGGRLATALGVGVGGNLLLQATTGRGLFDNINAIGTMGFGKRWEQLTGGMNKEGATYAGSCLEQGRTAFYGVPYRVIASGCEKGPDGYPKIKNLDTMIGQLYMLNGNTTDANTKNKIQAQIDFLKALKKDPSKHDILHRSFKAMGLKYDEISDPSNSEQLPNQKIDEAAEKLKKDANEEATTKPQTTTDTKTETQQGLKIDAPLQNIDTKIAQDLQKAKNAIAAEVPFSNANHRPIFEMLDGKLLLVSYGLKTPISYDGRNYHVGKLEIDFADAKHALGVANLTNRLIQMKSGKADTSKVAFTTGEPFKINSNDLQYGDAGKWFTWDETQVDGDDWGSLRSARPESTIMKIGGTNFEALKEKYSLWLNSFKYSNGKSIWLNGNPVNNTGDIDGFIAKDIAPIPGKKPETQTSTVQNQQTNATTSQHTTDKPDAGNVDQLTNINVKVESVWTPSTPEDKKKQEAMQQAVSDNKQENIVVDASKEQSELTPEMEAMAKRWKEKYDPIYKKDASTAEWRKKDPTGGMPIEFYKEWVKSYGKDGNYKLDFRYENTNYRRQGGDNPPTRHFDKAKKSWGIGNMK